MATFTVSNRNFNTTPVTSAPFDMPQKLLAAESVGIQLTSANWDSNAGRRLVLVIEQSFDNGAVWQEFSRDTFTKGARSRDGSLPGISFTFDDDGQGLARQRQLRVTVTAPDGVVNAGFVATF